MGIAKDTFTNIYARKMWGAEGKFNSGSGSRDPSLVNPYLTSVTQFLSSFKDKPSIVDLGCGDFTVGSKLRQYCSQYIACDIVEELITYNKKAYAEYDVDFRILDMEADALPNGTICIIKQVLQHLSNSIILSIIPKLYIYKYILITEHLPIGKFIANLDHPVSGNIRAGAIHSGIVLTEPPFKLKVVDEKVLCELQSCGGRIQTKLYCLTESL